MRHLLIFILFTSLWLTASGAETRIELGSSNFASGDVGTLKPDGALAGFGTVGDKYFYRDNATHELRSFIHLRLWGLKGATVTGAQLRFYLPVEGDNYGLWTSAGYNSVDASESLALFGFNQDVDSLRNGTGGAEAFAALASRPELGAVTVSPASQGTVVVIDMNQQGIAYIQQKIDAMPSNDMGEMVIGAALTTLSHLEEDEYLDAMFYSASDSGVDIPTSELVIFTEGPAEQPGDGGYRIDIGGKFQDVCLNQADCIEAGVDELVGRPFTASIVIPASSPDVVAEDPDRTYYSINYPRASFSFDTDGEEFDFDRFGEVRLDVQHCAATQSGSRNTGQCINGVDYLSFSLYDNLAGHMVFFDLRAPINQNLWLNDGGIPSITQLTSPSLLSFLTLCDADYRCIDTYNEEPYPQMSSIVVSWIPYVDMDVQLWDSANIVDLSFDEYITVSILSSSIAVDGNISDFDSADINPATLRLGLGEAEPVVLPWMLDSDDDSDIDMALGFLTQETGILCGDTELFVQGEKLSGEEFMAFGAIETTGCESSTCHP